MWGVGGGGVCGVVVGRGWGGEKGLGNSHRVGGGEGTTREREFTKCINAKCKMYTKVCPQTVNGT